MSTSPIRLDRLQAGLFAAVGALLPAATVVWGPSALPREAASAVLVSLQLLAGPTPSGAPSIASWLLPLSVRLTVGPVEAGETVGLEVSGRRFEHVAADTDSEAARDGLLAEIGDVERNAMVSATFAAVSTDAIDITADAIGDLYNLRAVGPCELATLTEQLAIAQLDEVESIVRVQIASTDRDVRTGAHASMAKLRHSLALPSTIDLLAAFGLTLAAPSAPVVPLDYLAGPVWQSRAYTDLRVRQVAVAAEAAGPVLSAVAMSLEFRDDPATITSDLSVEEP